MKLLKLKAKQEKIKIHKKTREPIIQETFNYYWNKLLMQQTANQQTNCKTSLEILVEYKFLEYCEKSSGFLL